jgi:hypothetical protein
MSNREISLILPSTGDPLILHYWLENLKTYRHLVSNVFISIDTMGKLDPMEYLFIENYLRRQISRHPGIRESINFLLHQHGHNINNLLEKFGPDLKENILVMEEDDYILNPDQLKLAIDTHFDENYDVTGYSRGCCSEFITQKTQEVVNSRNDLFVYRPNRELNAEFNFWPTLLLLRKDLLMKSSRDFGARTWYKGETIKFWDKEYTLTEDAAGDTLVSFSLELYNNPSVKRMHMLGNVYHSRMEDSYTIPPILSTSINFHVGSLSTVLANRFWKPHASLDHHGYIQFLRDLKKDEQSASYRHTLVEYYRRLSLLQQMLYSLKTPKNFEFFANYEKNIFETLELIEADHDLDKIFPTFGIAVIANGFDVSVYSQVFKKMI